MIVALILKKRGAKQGKSSRQPDEQGRYGSPGKQIRFWLITDILCIPRPNDLPRQPLGLFCAGFCDRESLQRLKGRGMALLIAKSCILLSNGRHGATMSVANC